MCGGVVYVEGAVLAYAGMYDCTVYLRDIQGSGVAHVVRCSCILRWQQSVAMCGGIVCVEGAVPANAGM